MKNVCYNIHSKGAKRFNLLKTEEVVAMTISDAISIVISLLDLIAGIVLGVLGLKSGDKKNNRPN